VTGKRRVTKRAVMPQLASIALGALVPLCFVPFGLWWLAPLLLAGIFVAWEGVAPATAFVRGMMFGFAAFATGTYWLYISIHEFGGAPPILAVVLMLLLFALMGAWTGIAGWLVNRLVPNPGLTRWMLLLPSAWVIVEWLRGWVFTGFPWLSLGYGQVDGPLSGWAPVGGVYLVSWIVALIAGCIVSGLRGGMTERRIAGVIVLVIATGSWLTVDRDWTRAHDSVRTVALVQGAVPQDRKWLPEQYIPTLDLYARLSASVAGADIVLWPEVAVPALASQAAGYLERTAGTLATAGSDLALGILTRDGASGQIRNSLIAPAKSQRIYHKRHLVPFGEYFPVPGFVREWMRMMNLPYSDIAAGERRQPMFQLAGVPTAPAICYEDAYGAELLDFLPGAMLLVSISNDAWFGRSIAAEQHLEIARVRALETGRPMLRATNTGITAIIDSRGQVSERLAAYTPGVATGTVTPRFGHTPYTRFGNWPTVLTTILCGLGALYLARRDT
jgi:apolipoprotein N-acyltransferase